MGSGLIGAVSICARSHGKPIGGSDKRGASRKLDDKLFYLAGATECDPPNERSCDRGDQRDRAWFQHGPGLVLGSVAGFGYSMRTNGVELGHIGEESGWARRGCKSGPAANGRYTRREHVIELLNRLAKDQRGTASERGCYWIEQCDSARDKHGLDHVYVVGGRGPNGM